MEKKLDKMILTNEQLKIENPFNEIINDGLTFRTFFDCKEDPRWNKFIAEKYWLNCRFHRVTHSV